jgi:nucleoside-diphosphate-sugar epimerase
MNILILGGDGFIGGHLAQALRAAGHRVTLGVRRNPNGVDRIGCDLARDRARDWLPRLRGIDLAINAAGLFQERRPGDFARLHDHGPRRLFIACCRAGVGAIQISAVGAQSPHPVSPFLASKGRADTFLLRLPISSAVVLPGLVVGEGGHSTAFFCALAVLPIVPAVELGDLPLIHIDRLCRELVALAADLPARGERRVLAEWRPLGEYLARLRAWLGLAPAPTLPIPIAPLALLFRVWPNLRLGLLNRDSLHLLMSGEPGREHIEPRVPGAAPTGPEPGIWADLAAPAPSRPYRLATATRFLPALGLASLVALWCWTAVCSLIEWPVSLGLIRAFGIDDPLWGRVAILGGAGLDAGLGLALFVAKARPAVLAGQMLLTAIYSLLVALALPAYWLHPFAPLGKNLALLVLTLWLYIHYREENRP